MSETFEVKVPDIGDFDSVDVIEVLVQPGASVAEDDGLVTLESDKASMDVPAPRAGRVKEVKVEVGDKVGEGDVVVVLEPAGDEEEEKEKEEEQEEEKEEEKEEKEEEQEEEKGETRKEKAKDGESEPAPKPQRHRKPPPREPAPSPATRALDEAVDEEAFDRVHASPAVRRLARELGVDLGRVEGSGRKGRITGEDLHTYVKARLDRPAASPGGGLPEMPSIDFSKFGGVERQELTRIQKRSGPNVHRSWLIVPHVTQFDEADITELEAFRKAHLEEAEDRGFKLTLLAFLMKACVPALRKFPTVNSSLDPNGEHLILKRYIHIGIAVDTEEGLVVPVVRAVDHKGIYDLAEELGEVSRRARERKLRPDDIQGASFTISSLGGIGGTAFTPIVNAPEVGILGVSRAVMKPVWRDGEFVPRLMLPLSFSYDHRVLDGATAARFTTYLASVLSDVRRILL